MRKALSLILFTVNGRLSVIKALHEANACWLIVTTDPRFNDDTFEHPEKAFAFIVLIFDGNVTAGNEVQSLNP